MSLRFYRPGQVYDLPTTLAAYVVAEGLAIVEMRADQYNKPFFPERRRNRQSAPHN